MTDFNYTSSEELSKNEAALRKLFTPDGFELNKVFELIDAADIGEMQKAALKATLETSVSNQEFLAQTLENAREALGIGTETKNAPERGR